MNRDGRGAVGEGMRPLTKQEIDRRIAHLVDEVAEATLPSSEGNGDTATRPRWIAADDLVRRLQRFMVYN
ncbi:MAG: hypothetical protein ACYTDX_10245 [Planctomycetota bacterium]|jgi:hypothetical protein